MTIKFIVDSMCETNNDILRRYDFDILPIPITFDDKTYYDGIDITSTMVLDFANKHKSTLPKTAQIQPLTITNAFEKHLKNGHDIIYLAFSSKLSGTYQTAKLLSNDLQEKYPDRKITVIDSLSGTTGTALILHQGLKLNKLNRSYKEITTTMTFLSQHIQMFFLVGDIQWLGKGGRISYNVAMIGNMLKIVPLLYFNQGEIKLYDKIRGQKKALKKLIHTVNTGLSKNPNQILGFVQSTAPELQEKAKKQIQKEIPIHNFMIPETAGAALTVHIGPNCLGIMYFDALPANYVNVCP
jgi:DegV family protein with EDD domain